MTDKEYLKEQAQLRNQEREELDIPVNMTEREKQVFRAGLVLGRWQQIDDVYTTLYDEEY